MTEVNDTKDRILDCARILFSEKGFEGTSIRDIATQAQVNVAAINYHFSNKENLFSEILRKGYQECSLNLSQFYVKESPSLEDVLIYLFDYFLSQSHDLVMMFKLMLSSEHNRRMFPDQTEDERLGPPGGRVILDAIIKELRFTPSERDAHFALKVLFTHVVHMALLHETCFKSQTTIPFSEIEDIKTNIKRLNRLILAELRSMKP